MTRSSRNTIDFGERGSRCPDLVSATDFGRKLEGGGALELHPSHVCWRAGCGRWAVPTLDRWNQMILSGRVAPSSSTAVWLFASGHETFSSCKSAANTRTVFRQVAGRSNRRPR